MNKKITPGVFFLLFVWTVPVLWAQSERGFAVDDLLKVHRVSDPQLSPDGKWIAYTVGVPDLEKNKVVSHLWLVSTQGGESKQLTFSEKGESSPRWSPDGKHLAFTSARGGSPQIWILPVLGGETWALTDLSTGASDPVWSPKGDKIAFTSEVWADCADDAANKKKAEEIEKSGIKARTIDRLLYRHWNAWRDGKRNHLFLISFDDSMRSPQKARDLTPGEWDVPPFSLGGPDAYAFSPDGNEIAFTRGPDAGVEAWSTNADLFVLSLETGEAKNLTASNKGWDGSPSYSAEGRWLAFRSQARDGFESDLHRLMLYDRKTGETVNALPKLEESVEEIVWLPEVNRPFILVQKNGSHELRFASDPAQGPAIFSGKNLSSISSNGMGAWFGALSALDAPADIVRFDFPSKKWTHLTRANETRIAGKEMPSYESVSFNGAKGAKIQAWLVKPAGYVPGKRYPFLLWIHGGPQGAWMDGWSYRWNPMLYASRGYACLLVNPHGSTGFGHEFTEQISGDWAGACYEDLMKATDWAIAQGIADEKRMGAMGGSFGGYMVNWILGHNDRFRALVSHCGVYNLESMYGVTEELWFPEWDLRGTPWNDKASNYAKFSPHRFAANFKTPTLVIHGELDFRVPIGEGLQLFTALQRQSIPSRLLYFPDEGHWVLKPKNSRLWNNTVLDWLDRFVMTPQSAGG